MAAQPADGLFSCLFGSGKGSGAAMVFFVVGMGGVAICIFFTLVLGKYKWNEKDGTAL